MRTVFGKRVLLIALIPVVLIVLAAATFTWWDDFQKAEWKSAPTQIDYAVKTALDSGASEGAKRSSRLAGHGSTILSVAFSPDGKYLATVSKDKTAKLWEVPSGRLVTTLKGHSHGVNSVAFSPDGKSLATGSDDDTAKLWEVPSGRLIITFTGHSGPVTSVAFSADGNYVATGSGDNTAKLWEVPSGSL